MNHVTNLPSLPARPDDGHKGTFGRAMLIAGSRGMSGAACLAGTSALRGGSGLVYVAVPEGIVSIVAGFEASYLTTPLTEDGGGRIDGNALAEVLRRSTSMDAVGIGPGLGQSTGLRLLVDELYRSLPLPLVVDADALNLLARNRGRLGQHAGPRLLTPHIGEFARLTGCPINDIRNNRESLATEFAKQHDVTLVLKGPGTIVTDGHQVAINQTGNSGMGTGGTGDVLTGLVTSLVGQGMTLFEAAHLGAHLHGLTGDLAAEQMTKRGMIASDLLGFLPLAWRVMETAE